MEKGGVTYFIWNLVNGKRYVGQTTRSIEVRFREHAACKKTIIGKAIQKYGEENFRYGVIKTCATHDELKYWEIHFIAALKSKVPYGYNLTDGGEGSTGCVISDETRAKLKAANGGENNGFFGRHHTVEFCAKRSKAERGETPFKNLLYEMDRLQITYTELGRLLGMTQSSISIKMSGKRRFTEKDKAKLAEIFGKPADYLVPPEIYAEMARAKRANKPFQNLLNEMEKRHITIIMFAKLMGLTLDTIRLKLNGKRKFTDKDKAKLESIFGKSAEYLLKRDENCAEPAKARREDSPYKNLLKELDARNISYRRFAELLGLSQTSVARKIRGERNFTIENKIKFTEIFGKPIEYLLKCE